MSRGLTSLVLLLLAPAAFAQAPPVPPPPAYAAAYARTTSHADVVAYCAKLAESPRAHRFDFGRSHEGRALPALVLAPGKVTSPEQAKARNKPVVLAFANIHAGEVDGKEALLALAREFTTAPPDSPTAKLLDAVTLLLVPDLNADGNERVSDKNRTDQNGPKAVGDRANAQGLDLNRDFVKLESPEVRSLIKLVTQWDPVVVVDCHTTNGSYHRYALTHDGPRHPAAGRDFITGGERVLRDVTGRMAAAGFAAFPYGDFSPDHTRWTTYPALPRFGVQCLGLRGTLGLLSESYTYSPFPDRVKASRAFVLAAIEHVAANGDAVKKLVADARTLRPRVAVRTKTVARPMPDTIRGYVEEVKSGQVSRTDTTKDYSTVRVDVVEPALEVPTPAAYVIPPGYPAVVQTLQRHGIRVEELVEDVTHEPGVFTFRVREVGGAPRPFQGHVLRTLDGTRVRDCAADKWRLQAGSAVVSTAQPLGNLAAYLLEPQSEDGLAAWNFFDKAVAPDGLFPVVMLAKPLAALTVPAAPLPEDAPKELKPVTVDVVLANRGGFGGASPALPDWLPDGEHVLQARGGRLMKVHAGRGTSEPFFDRDRLKKSLAAVPGIPDSLVEATLRQPVYRMDPARTGTLVTLGVDLVFARFDGTPAVRLSESPKGTAAAEFSTISPDGKHVGYVRAGDLVAVPLAGGKELRLTTDGRPAADGVLNGKADWVYEEEIFDRNGRAFWWHPFGGKVVFMRFDDKPVTPFHIVKSFPAAGELETIPYPKAGAPNPHVSLHVADAATGAVTRLNLGDYQPADTVISRVGWLPGGHDKPAVPFAYVQNRTQTWLDFVTWPDAAGLPVRLFRDTTKAWVEDLGAPHVLANGDFLVTSERTGWKHLYRYTPAGKLVGAVTSGGWEAQTVERVDEPAGVVYVTGTKDGPTRTHLYRAKLDGTSCDRVTPESGTHAVKLAPKGPLYFDRASDFATPAVTTLRDLVTGASVRVTDATPARGLSQYKRGKSERVRVPLKDGFTLDGVLTYPPDFDPAKKHGLWVLTYAGPHHPTVKDAYAPRLTEHAVANTGAVAFNVDPRSASGQGAQSAWTAYRRLGAQELADLEEAVAWVGAKGWLDPARVGISGHSYGGTTAAYALTHGKTFTAGVAGAPVTDWRLYDTIYTERYMGTPADNPKGYDDASVVKAAANLHGRLLLCHGLADDNVHAQNTAQLVEAFQRAGKTSFEVMIYPSARHGIPSPHYIRTQIEFIRKTVGARGGGPSIP